MNNSVQSSITRKDGVTLAERYLKRLCDRTFLSLWSYAGIYRDQFAGGKNKGQGKEVCDLLVVFENHVLIFSDKDCKFPNTGNLKLDWQRWYRRAVKESAEQLWGAERWIREHPDRLFLDSACTIPLPIVLPAVDEMVFHRILVAHDASEQCRKELGGSGSLMIKSDLLGAEMPFAVGQINPTKGYVHVLDDTSVDILLKTLDTITDFTSYLFKKEKILRDSATVVFAAGEEELLGLYLSKVNEEDEHDFIFPPNFDGIGLGEGQWNRFVLSQERQAQIEANRISYSWDALIEKFNKHILSGTQYYTSPPGIENQERILRFLAREPRTRRRMLANAFVGLIEKTPNTHRATRVVFSSKPNYPYYIFLVLPRPEGVSYSEYREGRRVLLEAYVRVTKLQFPEAKDIIGLATEAGPVNDRSEDAMYFDARVWTEKDQSDARDDLKSLEELGLLGQRLKFSGKELEYPKQGKGTRIKVAPVPRWPTHYPRNKPCPCGSGKKYKYCCGKNN